MRQYKLLEITTQYEEYIKRFYNTHQTVDQLSYDELYSLIVDDGFGEADFIHRYFNKMGIESKVIFYNNRNLQNKWSPHQKDITYFDILLLQIKEFAPDVILISSMEYFSPEETMIIKECLGIGKIRLVGFYFTALNDRFRKNALLYDQIYTGSQFYVGLMKDWGLPAYLLRHAFDTSNLDKVPDCERKNEICFLGSIVTGKKAHNNRLDMLEELTKSNLPYVFYGNIYGSLQEILSSEEGKKYIGIIAEIASNMKMGVFGMEYYSIMNQYNICLNLHAPSVDRGAGNMRMFEATGMGICLLTDYRCENVELFDVTDEIVVYDCFEEMVDKAKWLLDNPKKAREIALAGQRRTLSEYTYKNKAEHLNDYIQTLIV